MSSMTGGMANSFSEWAGGLADSQGKLGEIFSSKVDALIGDVTERINQIGNNLSNQVMDRIEMGLLHQSGKISAVTSSFKTISKYLNGGKYTDNMSMHTKGVIWPGFAPYFKFKPSSDRTTDFNQPSTWIFLNKSHDQFQGKTKDYGKGKTPWVGKFGWQHGELEAALDTSMAGARQMVFFEGLNAWSRGMAYYHRPGNWNEQPNFFNPYWRARLAPIGQKLQAFWERFVGQQLSGDDIVVSQLLSAIRNAQMELVTAFVSSLVTH